MQTTNGETNWAPENKIVAAAIATLVMTVIQLALPQMDIPVGVEGAVAVIVGYFMPNTR